mgnify:CR=1 FL=1
MIHKGGYMSAETQPRAVHFVGSYPAEDAETAMHEMLDGVEGLPLASLSDGETGQRNWWIGRMRTSGVVR